VQAVVRTRSILWYRLPSRDTDVCGWLAYLQLLR